MEKIYIFIDVNLITGDPLFPKTLQSGPGSTGLKSKRLFSPWVPGPVKNVHLFLWASLAQIVTLCALIHLALTVQPLLVLLVWLRPNFCPHSSEDALLGHLLFSCGLPLVALKILLL